MNKVRSSFLGLVVLLVLVSGVFASQDLTFFRNVGNDISMVGLDEQFTDSLSYHDFTGAFYAPSAATNYYIGVKFTPPVDFNFHGIRFYADPIAHLTTVQAKVYSDNNGQPGDVLLDMWDGAPSAIDGSWVELIIDEEDQFDIAQGTNFWVVIGPVPGSAGGSWNCILDQDGAEPGDRNRWTVGTDPTNLDWDAPYDWVVVAGGQFSGGFYDLNCVSVYNDIQSFQMTTDSTVTFSGKISNVGVSASPAGTAVFSVKDSDDTEVFTNTVNFDAVGANASDTTTVVATESWTPTTNGRYYASMTITGDAEEGNLDNNEYLLLQDVINVGDWYSYDDGTFETNVSSTGGGWAVPFHPISYPAKIDSVQWYFLEAATAAHLILYTFDSVGLLPAWEYNGAVAQGWNTFEINDENLPNGINIAEGMFIGVYEMTGDLSFTSDSNPPTAAANPNMPDASFSYSGGEMYLDVSGNWAIRAKISEGTEPARPHLEFPVGVFDFGTVAAGETHTKYLVFENTGDLFANIDSVRFQNISEDVFSIGGDFPKRVEANSLDSLEIIWTPDGTNGISGPLFIHHNDPIVESPAIVGVTGSVGTSGVVSSDNAIPDNYFLAQNHPNPFNPTTSIQFGLPEAGQVKITVYNVMGQEVARLLDNHMSAGTHSVILDGTNLSSGIYFYSLEAPGFRSLKKMSLMK